MILNIAAYHFVVIDDPDPDPDAVASMLRACAEAGGLRGTVLVAGEGINLFLAGDDATVQSFLDVLRGDPRFAAIAVKASRSRAQPFARLKVKVKPEIISFRRDDTAPPAQRAPGVAPAVLARWIGQGQDDRGRRLVLLDMLNREEVGYGTFAGALTLPIDNFTELHDALAPHRESLDDARRLQTPVSVRS